MRQTRQVEQEAHRSASGEISLRVQQQLQHRYVACARRKVRGRLSQLSKSRTTSAVRKLQSNKEALTSVRALTSIVLAASTNSTHSVAPELDAEAA